MLVQTSGLSKCAGPKAGSTTRWSGGGVVRRRPRPSPIAGGRKTLPVDRAQVQAVSVRLRTRPPRPTPRGGPACPSRRVGAEPMTADDPEIDRPGASTTSAGADVSALIILRKEVIQPQVPLRLPCYDLVPIRSFTFGVCLAASTTSGAPPFGGLTGGVYKAQEHIHRGTADPRLLAIPASCRRVAACNLNWGTLFAIRLPSQACSALYAPL